MKAGLKLTILLLQPLPSAEMHVCTATLGQDRAIPEAVCSKHRLVWTVEGPPSLPPSAPLHFPTPLAVPGVHLLSESGVLRFSASPTMTTILVPSQLLDMRPCRYSHLSTPLATPQCDIGISNHFPERTETPNDTFIATDPPAGKSHHQSACANGLWCW